MNYVLQGIARVATDRTLWPYVVKPVAYGCATYLVLLIIGVAVVRPWVERWAAVFSDPMAAGAVSVGGWLMFALVWIFVSGVLFMTLNGIFAGFVWDKLSERIEAEELGMVAKCPLTAVQTSLDMVARVALATLVGFAGLLASWMFPLVGPLALVGGLALLDFTCGVYLRRGKRLGKQLVGVWKLPGALGFAIGAGLVTLIPFANVLLFPGLVVGGTRLAARGLGR